MCSSNTSKPGWLKPYNRVFPRKTTGTLTHASLAEHAVRTAPCAPGRALKTRCSSESTFSHLKLELESIGRVSGAEYTHVCADQEVGSEGSEGSEGGDGSDGSDGSAGSAGSYESGAGDRGGDPTGEESDGSVDDENRAPHVRYISQREVSAMQRARKRHVVGSGVYFYPQFRTQREEDLALKAPRRGCIQKGDVLFTYGTYAIGALGVTRTRLAEQVSHARRVYNARVVCNGGVLVAVAIDQILAFREVIVDESWV
jgi:hypothetical protein